ncbi:NAD(P)-binding domain protein [Akanthomyces lecanii RCEF 1005]|uniref:NAD(P)-binding domain protein n=1 Tax=Akanthomyces lecanii RCEF 1005 TaxID=1081108 RepID=A0A168FSJ5_CORDF|nr:NAD(P)-binding domain protein [Akanthomyces lecanii RCEF 1005]
MSKLITVFGCTGNQGGSVVKYILNDAELSKEYRIRGITRDTTKKSAQQLAKDGVELVTADLNSTESLTSALAGSHTVFLVTNYWETTDGDLEYQQGKNVTDVAQKVGVSRILFSSLLHVTDESKGRLTHVPHFDSKANIEKYIRASGLDCTFFLPGYYMSLFIGAALKHASSLRGAQILGSGSYYTPKEIVDTFSQVLGKKATFLQVSADEYKSTLPPAVAAEYLDNQLFVEDPGYFLGASLEPTLTLLDARPTTWAEFLKKNASAWD